MNDLINVNTDKKMLSRTMKEEKNGLHGCSSIEVKACRLRIGTYTLARGCGRHA